MGSPGRPKGTTVDQVAQVRVVRQRVRVHTAGRVQRAHPEVALPLARAEKKIAELQLRVLHVQNRARLTDHLRVDLGLSGT